MEPTKMTRDAAGLEGLGYEEARRSVGTLLERAERAERERDEARAELERLRRLPVIATCGECGHVGFGDYCTHPRFDGLEKHERPELSHDAAPPEWCPLRGAR